MSYSQVSVNELAQVCANSADAAEWEEFLRRTTPLASLVVSRVARLWVSSPAPAMIDDIVQEVYLKLCEQERRILREFTPRGEDSFLGLLRIVAGSVANDYFRRLCTAKRGGKVVITGLTWEFAPGAADTSGGAKGVQNQVLLSQLDQLLREAGEDVSERDRNLFWLYYLQGLTAVEISSLPGVGLSAKGVESALRRISGWLRHQIERRRPDEEFDHGQPATVTFEKENRLNTR
jgi:RNA polymerase sigma-70 factor, ECF subfamily